MKSTKSLSFFVTLWLAVGIAVSMAAYAVYQYRTIPSLSVRELIVGHLGHVLGLGIVIYVLCWGVFYFVLLRPLNRIYLHLYTVGAGHLRSLELRSNVREIRTIADGINLMLSRLKLGADDDALERAQRRIDEIRDLTLAQAKAEHEHVSAVLDKLADLQRSLPAILAAGTVPPNRAEGCPSDLHVSVGNNGKSRLTRQCSSDPTPLNGEHRRCPPTLNPPRLS